MNWIDKLANYKWLSGVSQAIVSVCFVLAGSLTQYEGGVYWLGILSLALGCIFYPVFSYYDRKIAFSEGEKKAVNDFVAALRMK